MNQSPLLAVALRRGINPRFYWTTTANAITLSGTRYKSATPTRTGIDITLQLTAPTTIEHVRRALPRIAVLFALPHCTVTPTDRADRVVLSMHYNASPSRLCYPLANGWAKQAATPLPLGQTDDGSNITLNLYGHSLLIAGMPGSGKSTAIRSLLAGLSQQENVALYGIDPKHVELRPFAARFTRLVTGNTAAPTIELLQDLVDQVQERAEHMSRRGLVSLTPSPEFPSIVLIIDEWAELAADGDKKERELATTLLRRFISLGRAVGCSAVLATQKPTADSIDPGTRALLSYRIAYRCADKWHSESVLGAGNHSALDIPISQPGRAYLQSDRHSTYFQTFELAPVRIPQFVRPLLRIHPGTRHFFTPNKAYRPANFIH